MARIRDFVDDSAPVTAETCGSDVYDRFQAEPSTLAIAVVDPDGRPLGLVERNAFCLQMGAEFGRALYARRPISTLMDAAPTTVEADADAESLFSSVDAAEMETLLKGFIAISGGLYAGIGTALHVLRASSAINRRRAEAMSALAQDLARAEAEARASSRAKSEFLAVMSHEIRTPLNGVLGVAALMERELTQEVLRPYVRTILDSGHSLLRLLTDALDMSRAQAGSVTLEEAPVHLNALASDLEALWKARAQEKGLGLFITCDTDPCDWVVGDEMRIKQILNNLVGNALKFTRVGEISVNVVSAWDHDAVKVEVTVDDSGPGIPTEAQATIFDPFNTGNAGREGAGAGMGLAICRQIVDRMGGTIAVGTSPNGGARFHFSLRLASAGPEIRAAAQAIAEPTPHETLHVLVVDDNATNRFVAGKLLEMFGCTVEYAEDGAQAVEAATTRLFDLILMDVKMPVMDGVAATQAIRKHPAPIGHIPILALTANADPRDEADYLAAGMNGVAQKPIQPDALLNAIRLVMSVPATPTSKAA